MQLVVAHDRNLLYVYFCSGIYILAELAPFSVRLFMTTPIY